MAGRYVSASLLADNSAFDRAWMKSAETADATADQITKSAAKAGESAAAMAKAAGASADEQEAAAARAAASYVEAASKITAAQDAAGKAALRAAELAGKSADEQVAAYQRAVAATAEYEDAQKRAADATKLVGDAQADAAAKVDLLGARLGSLGGRTAGVAAEISKLGGIGFAASIAGAGDLAAKFQQATEQIAANSDTSSASAAKIGRAFLTTSGQSIFSAKEMTEAFAPVAGQLKATEGAAVGAAGAMKVMAAASDLAEGTGETLTDSTAALAMVMQGYRLPVTQAAAASDLLFNTSRALNQPLGTIAQAITTLHGRLGALAPSLGDVGSLMVELGSHGVQGSRGVTVVSSSLAKLLGGSAAVQQTLTALHVNLYNSQGDFVGLQKAIELLQPALEGLPPQLQNVAASTLFGSRAWQVMLSTVKRGPDAFATAETAAQKLGTSHAAAADQTKTLGKQLDILKASVENDATSIGLKLIPALVGMVKGLEDGIDWMEKHKTAADALGIAIGTVLAGAVTVFAYQKATAFVTGVKDMAIGISKVSSSLTGGLIPALERTGPSITGIGVASTKTTDVVVANDAKIVTANDAAGASFKRMIPIIGGVLIAADALRGPMSALSKDLGLTGSSYTGKKGAYTPAQAEAFAAQLQKRTGGMITAQSTYQAIAQGGGIRKSAASLDPDSAGTGIDLTPAYLKKARAAEAEGLTPGSAAFQKATGIGAGPTNIADRILSTSAQGDIQQYRSAAQSGSKPALERLLSGGEEAKYYQEIEKLHAAGLTKLVNELVAAHKQALDALSKHVVSLLQPGTVQAAAATLQTTQVTDQTQIISDAAQAQVTIIKDQQTLQSDAMQAAAQHITDSANVMAAKITAAATAITDASTVSQDKSSAIVTGMQDATQIETDKLGERLLYGYELQAQRDQVQLDVLKEGFDKQIAVMQEQVDETKQHWDGRIAAAQIQVATVTQHQDQLVAIAQQKANQVQLREDTLLGDATNQADTVTLAADMREALAQQAVSLARTPTQKQQAQNTLTEVTAQSGQAAANAAQVLATITGNVNRAETNAAGAYQHAQDVASTRITAATSKLTITQAEAQRAEARLARALQRLTDNATRQEQKLTDLIAVTQAGGSRRIVSDSRALSYVGGGGGGLAVGSETPYRTSSKSGGNTVNVHIENWRGPDMTSAQAIKEFSIELRSLSTAPPL